MNISFSLGVTVNAKLNWVEHCDKLNDKANSQLGLLMRTCHFTTNKKQKKTFYLTIVRSIFEHCSVIWRPKSSNQISKFDAIQKRAVKWIHGQYFQHYSDSDYLIKQTELKIMPIKLKFYQNDLIMFYKIVNSLVPINLPEHFTFLDSEQLRYTRRTAQVIDKKDITQASDVTITQYAAAFTSLTGQAPLVLAPGQEAAFSSLPFFQFFIPHFGNDGSFLSTGNQVDVETFSTFRTGSDEWTEFSPSAKIAFRPNQDMLLYAGFSSGFKSGGFDTSGSETRTVSYKPEIVDTFSVGLKSTLANGSLQLNLELFSNDYTEKQLQSIALLPTGLESITDNVGKVESTGAEIEVIWLPPVEGLTVNLNLGFLNSDIEEFIELQDDGAGGFTEVNVASNFELGYAPETTAQAGVRYDFAIEGNQITLGTNVAYRSELFTNSPINITNPFFLNAESESRTIWNAMLAFRSESGHWRVALEGKNLSDERSLVNTFNVTNFITGGYTRGRTWALSVRYDI